MGGEPAAEPIAITGIGCLFPGAPNAEVFWQNLLAGVDATSDVPPERWGVGFNGQPSTGQAGQGSNFYCRRGGFLDSDLRPERRASQAVPTITHGPDPGQRIALAQAAAALADGGDPLSCVPRERVGVIVGRGGYQAAGALGLHEAAHELIDPLGPDGAEAATGLVPSMTASRIASRFDLQGLAYTVDASCASTLIAVDHGVRELTARRCDLVIAGGVHHCHDVTLWSAFTRLGVLSREQQIRPFSARADGLLFGEGSAFFVLKRLADAERDRDRIYAVVRGVGIAANGRSGQLISSDVAGQAAAVRRAWSVSRLDPRSVGLIEAHGAGTPASDRAELEGLALVFGPSGNGWQPGLGSVKSMIGHAMAAAGAAGLAKAALAVHHGVRPPTLHADDPHPLLATTPFRLLREAEPWSDRAGTTRTPRLAGVSAFGFGGINAHLVLEEHSPPVRRDAPRRRSHAVEGEPTQPSTRFERPRLMTLAAATPGELGHQLSQVGPDATELTPDGGPARLAVIDPSPRRVELARRVVERAMPWRGHEGVWFEPEGLLTAGGKLALLFPGTEPGVEFWGADPPSGPASAQNGAGLHGRVRSSLVAGLLLHRAFRELGLQADMVAGHGLGSWTAEVVAGVLVESDVEALIGHIASTTVPVTELTCMTLDCGVARARHLSDGLADIAVAYDNSPRQTVVSGPGAQIEVLAERCRQHQVLTEILPAPAGFHTPRFEQQLPDLARLLADLPRRPPSAPLWSATTCRPYPSDPAAIRTLARRHMTEPVRFRELALALHAAGARVFVQMGQGSLGGFVEETLREHDTVSLAANVSRQPGLEPLAAVAAALWTQGRTTALNRLTIPPGEVRPDRALPPARSGHPRSGPGRSHPPLPHDGSGRSAVRTLPVPQAVTRHRRFSVAAEPAWAGHSLLLQPDDWPHLDDRLPCVPLAGIVEVMTEVAVGAQPGSVVVAVEDVVLSRTLLVEPPVTVAVRATPVLPRDAYGSLRVNVIVEGHARATVILAPRYQAPAAPADLTLTGGCRSPLSADDFYRQRYTFHGPSYQGISRLLEVAENGSRGRLRRLRAPGALLDAGGQLLGHWLACATEQPGGPGPLLRPAGIERVEFFGPQPDVGTEVDCVLQVTDRSADTLTCDMVLSGTAGPWCRVTGWRARSFPVDNTTAHTLRWPERTGASEPAGPLTVLQDRWSDPTTRDLVMRRYLSGPERRAVAGRVPLTQRQHLLTQVVVKDAVRRWLWAASGTDARPIFPGEVMVSNDTGDRPRVTGPFTADLRVAVSQADDVAVAMVAEGFDPAVGIDVVEPRRLDFETLLLSARERHLAPPSSYGRDAWLTCLWTLKETAAKATGRSLHRRPTDCEVVEHDGGVARVATFDPTTGGSGSRRITVRLAFIRLPAGHPDRSPKKKEHVVAWTLDG